MLLSPFQKTGEIHIKNCLKSHELTNTLLVSLSMEGWYEILEFSSHHKQFDTFIDPYPFPYGLKALKLCHSLISDLD